MYLFGILLFIILGLYILSPTYETMDGGSKTAIPTTTQESKGTGDGKGYYYWNDDNFWLPPPVPMPPPVKVCTYETPAKPITLPSVPLGPILVIIGVYLFLLLFYRYTMI